MHNRRMTASGARRWLILSTLTISTSLLLFFILAPVAGFPIQFSQSFRVLEVIVPVFLGYLGTAALFVFRAGVPEDDIEFRPAVANLVGLLVKGPVLVFGLGTIALIAAFGLSNGKDAAAGTGVSLDQLSGGMSMILGLLAVTTNVAVAYLFRGHSPAQPGTTTQPANVSPANRG